MKQVFKKTGIAFLLAVTMVTSIAMTSCQRLNSDTDKSNNLEDGTIIVSKLVMNDLYKTMPELAIDEPIDSYTDGSYNYFYFKLGEVARVPIAYTKGVFYQGIGKRTLNFEATSSIQNILSTTTEQCISKTVSSKITSGINGNMGVMNKASGTSANLGAYISNTLSNSSTHSTSEKITDTITETFTKREQDIFELDPKCPAGVYRYTVYANCEIYAVVVADIKNETFEYTFMPFVKNDSLIEGWVYSEDGYYETDETIYSELEKFSLDNVIEKIDLFGEIDKFINVRQGTFHTSKTETVDEDHLYTLFCDLKTVFNEELFEDFGYSKAIIKTAYKIKTPEGACQFKMRARAGDKELYISDFMRVDSSGKNWSTTFEVSLEDLMACDYMVRLEHICRGDGVFDILKNSFYIESLTIEIEME